MAARLFTTFLVMGLVIAGVSYYVSNRASQSATLSHITSVSQIENVAPTECLYQTGAYGTGGEGHMYIYNNQLLVSIQNLDTPEFYGTMLAVIGIDGTRLLASESEQRMAGKDPAVILGDILTKAPWSCYPWWFPTESLFNIPNAVTF